MYIKKKSRISAAQLTLLLYGRKSIERSNIKEYFTIKNEKNKKVIHYD